ncbi:MAG: hypothetical protein ACRDWD_12270 [Acidimicrobiia bacterium]
MVTRVAVAIPPRRRAPLLPWREVVAPWLVSRALAAAVIIGSRSYPWDGSVRFEGFDQWDGGFYLQIAGVGYGPPPVSAFLSSWPFFPLLPGLIRGIDEIGLPDRAGIVVLNQVALLVALAGVWRLASRHAPPAAAWLSVWALALFPSSFLFSMVYPSAIFLAASVWAFVFIEDRLDVPAAALAVVAAMTRPNGIVLAVALAIAVRSPRRIAMIAGPAAIVVGVWCLLCWHWTGDPFVFWSGKSAWVELDLLDVVRWQAKLSVIPHLGLGLAALGVTAWKRRSLPPAWVVLTVIYLIPPLALGIVGMGRYAAECFPPFIAAGMVLAGWSSRGRALVLASGAIGMVLLGMTVVHFTLVP